MKAWLEGTERRWLVVFDNAVDERLVDSWRPVRGRGRVLVTTRRGTFGALGSIFDVPVFDPDTAATFSAMGSGGEPDCSR